MSQTDPNGSSTGPESCWSEPQKFTLSDDDLALSFTLYFTWGYPDYVREAFRVMQDARPSFIPCDPNREHSYKEMNEALKEADTVAVRYLVAGNAKTPACVLDYLSKQSETKVAMRVAENGNCHRLTLSRLSKHEDSAVRLAVCQHTSTPEEVLIKLTSDSDTDVRYVMAENPNMPPAVLELLMEDDNPYVANRAKRTLNSITYKEVATPEFKKWSKRTVSAKAN